MATGVLNVWLDTVEPRITEDRKVVIVDGRHWDILNPNTTAYVDGVTRTAMLKPLCLTDDWKTNTSGLYARLGKADVTFEIPPFAAAGTPPPYPNGTPSDGSKWKEDHNPYQGNIYLVGQGVNDRVRTNRVWPKNQPFFLSWFSFNAGQSSQVQMECGWLAETMFIAVRIWTDGKAEIYKNGIQVGQGNIFEDNVTTQTVYGKQKTGRRRKKVSKSDARQMANQFVELMIIPCRRRDLLFISNQGGGFRFTFEDIDPDNPDSIITPSGSFFWQEPVGQAKALFAPLRFSTASRLVSDPRISQLPIRTDDSPFYNLYYDLPGYGAVSTDVLEVREADDSGLFSPDNKKDRMRLAINLYGDGTATPFIYGASAVFPSRLGATPEGVAANVTSPYIQKATLSVPVNPADVKFSMELAFPQALESSGVSGIRSTENRPIEVRIGDSLLLAGRTVLPKSKYGTNDAADRVSVDARDRCVALEEYRIRDGVPVDGLDLGQAFIHFATLPGFSMSDMDVQLFGLRLPTIGQHSEGEFALRPETGDKAIEWIERLLRGSR